MRFIARTPARHMLLVLSLGLVPAGPHCTDKPRPPPHRLTDGTINLSYHLQALKRNEQGHYEMTGTLRGERSGEANVEFGFDEGSSGVPGHALVHAYWVVRAEPESESFKARLKGRPRQASAGRYSFAEMPGSLSPIGAVRDFAVISSSFRTGQSSLSAWTPCGL